MNEEIVKQEIVFYGKKVVEKGLVVGPGGNISGRCGNKIFLSPSGYALDELEENNLSIVDIDSGKSIENTPRPTCEIEMHLTIFRERKDVDAIIHTHPPIATGLISGGYDLSPMTPDVCAYVAPILHLDFILPATKKLARSVRDAVRKADVIALRNHGIVTVGKTFKEAFVKSIIVEESAKVQIAAIIAGKPNFLSQEDIMRIKESGTEEYRRNILRGWI